MSKLNDLKKISTEVAEYYDNVHKVIKMPDNSFQYYRTKDIKLTYQDIITDSSIEDNMKVLDAGFGLGNFDHYLTSNIKCDVTAISYSEVEVEKARKLYSQKSIKGDLKFIRGDFHFLQDIFPNESFDMVMFLESFEHAYDKEKVLADSYAILKEGGKFFIKYSFLLWTNAEGREEAFSAALRSETDSMRIFTHITLPDFLKQAIKIGFSPLLIKTPSINCADAQELLKEGIESCNEYIEGFKYESPGFLVTQCFNVLLEKPKRQ